MSAPTPVFEHDLDTIVDTLASDWNALRGARIFVTGGTGFIGRWMLESLYRADQRLGFGCEVVAISRDPAAFARKAPHLAGHRHFTFVAGDVGAPLQADGAFSHIIHAATDASADLNLNNPKKMFDTVVDGTRHALDLAVANPSARFMFFSSGAIYGQQPWEETHVSESWRGGPDCQNPLAAYAEGKRAAEMMCAIHARQFGIDVVTARIFAALGPMFPLDIHFAVGNFIRDALRGDKIVVQGAGQALRSFLYASDLAVWLWAMLIRARPGAVYNVGSEDAISIADLAARIAHVLGRGDAGYEILGRPDPGWNPGRYIPSTKLIRGELGVEATIGLDEAIRRTALHTGWTA